MTTQIQTEPNTEARQRIAVAAGAALLGAGLILVMFILPAEFAVDRSGRRPFVSLDLGRRAARRASRQRQVETAARRSSSPGASVQEETIDFTTRAGSMDTSTVSTRAKRALRLETNGRSTIHAEPEGRLALCQTYEKGSQTPRRPAVTAHRRHPCLYWKTDDQSHVT